MIDVMYYFDFLELYPDCMGRYGWTNSYRYTGASTLKLYNLVVFYKKNINNNNNNASLCLFRLFACDLHPISICTRSSKSDACLV